MLCASWIWPSSSCSRYVRLPCSTPGRPRDRLAACSCVSMPRPAASTPISRTEGSSRNGWNSPIAFDPPPMQATAASGSRPSASCNCALRLLADHRLEVAHHHRIRMRAGDGADQVVGVLDVGDPVAHRLVHRVLQRAGARRHRLHLGAEQLHAEHVGLLPLHVGRAHVDGAGQAEQRAHRGGGDAVLAGAGLGDDAGLAHAPGQQDLAHAVVGLVAAGVVQLVALEVDLGAAEFARQPFGEPQRAGAADIVLQIARRVRSGTRDRRAPRDRPARPPGSAASASRRRTGRRTRRSGRARPGPSAGCWTVSL